MNFSNAPTEADSGAVCFRSSMLLWHTKVDVPRMGGATTKLNRSRYCLANLRNRS